MSSNDPHPLSDIVAPLAGVHVVTGADALRPGANDELNVSVIIAMAPAGGQRAALMFADLTLAFVPDGIKLNLAPAMRGQGFGLLATALEMGPDGTLPAYSVGIDRCHCPPEKGGPLWNPLCVALAWAPALDGARSRVANGWWELVQRQPELFCHGGMATMRLLGLA